VNRKYLLLGLVALALIALGAVAYFWFFAGGGNDTIASEQQKYGITLTSYDRTMGSPKAPLLVVEYAAPTCPHCAHFDEDMFPEFKKNWIDTGKAYYVFRVFPLNAVDVAAESMARCLPANDYFQFIDLLYRNQPKWDPDGYEIPDVHTALVEMGEMAGMTASQVDACIGDEAAQKRIAQIGQDAMTKYGIQGTPSFIVNGQMHGPFASYQEFDAFLKAVAKKK
jgi:protein-disulfide isomerase